MRLGQYLFADGVIGGNQLQHSAVRIALVDGILDVAMIDPKSLKALEELREVGGHRAREVPS